MIKTLLRGSILPVATACLAGSFFPARAFEPVAPGNLNADVNGMVVDLSWEWGNAGETVSSSDFEWDDFPTDTWSVKNTYSYDDYGNWMLFDFSEEMMSLAHGGDKGAVVMIGTESEDDPAANHQDEWLIVKPGEGAVYMDFWYFLHPELRELGAYQEFPDHYYVKISRDNGETWSELWDGRWDMGPVEGVQQASLFLGDETDEDTLVAFEAVSGEDQTLYFLWCVDDVEFFSAEEMQTRTLTAKASTRGDKQMIPEGLKVKKDFVPMSFARHAARLPESEWLNNGHITYRVYLDGELMADYLKTRRFTDYSTKEAGEHTYEVMAWSEALDEEFEAADVDVEIGEVVFAAPRNIKASFTEHDNGKYVIQATWDAPDGEQEPTHYQVYINDKSVGWIDVSDELAIGQSGLYKGAYTFAVEACYEFPEGVSERVTASVFPGTYPTPENLSVKEDGEGVTLTWDAPSTDEAVTYSIFRGDVLLANGIEATSYTDTETLAGICIYSVRSEYGEECSLPATAQYFKNGFEGESLPFEENFSNGNLPANWNVDLVDPNGRVKEMYSWRFDNWFSAVDTTVAGMDGGFASISAEAAGMSLLQCHLVSPEIVLPEEGVAEVMFLKYFFEETAGPSGPAQFILSLSEDNGVNWVDLSDLREVADGEVKVSLSEYAGKRVMLRWSFLGRNSGVAAVDKVRVTSDNGNGISTVLASDGVYDVYTADGIVVGESLTAEAVKSLPAGLYIMVGKDGKAAKHIVR